MANTVLSEALGEHTCTTAAGERFQRTALLEAAGGTSSGRGAARLNCQSPAILAI